MKKTGRQTGMLLALLGLAALVRAGLLVADVLAPMRTIELRAQDVTSATPGLFTVPVVFPHEWWWRADSDSNEAPAASTLVLHEDARVVGPPHMPHADIANGGGRYSHWGDWLYFSTPDGSDPRSNGRHYRVELRLTIAPWLVQASNAVLAASLLLATLVGLRHAFRDRRAACAGETIVASAGAVVATAIFGRPGSSARRRAGIASAGLLGLVLVLAWCTPERSIPIAADAVQTGSGHLRYAVLAVPLAFPYRILSDSAEDPQASTLRLFEDDRELEPGHAEHSIIETQGAGHYSFWNGYLYFSSADGTEPAAGVHRYTASFKPALSRGLLPAAGLLFIVTTALAWPAATARFAQLALSPLPALTAGTKVIVVLLATMACCGFVAWNWIGNAGLAPAPSIAGYLPLSDALGYNTCATQAAMLGHFMEHYEFCSRRTLYPSLLASFHLVTRSQVEGILLLQAGIVATVISFLALRVARVLSPLAALFTGVVLFAYASQYVLGLFMTEFAGLVFGTLALSLFCDESDSAFRRRFTVACALISIALVARNGAMFVLPALLAWAVFERRHAGLRELVRVGLLTAGALAFGLLLQRLILGFNGVEAVSSFNNFATVLYRLSIGAKDWTQALIDYPKLPDEPELVQFARIYGHALDNIQAQPAVFLGALGRAFVTYLATLYQFAHAQRYAPLLNGLTLMGLAACALGWRQRSCRLLLCLAVGEMLSAPLIVEDGGMRVFAATIAVRVVLAAAGLVLALALITRAAGLMAVLRERVVAPFHPDTAMHGHRHEFALATVLVVLMVFPYVDAMSAALRPAPLRGSGCASGMREIVVDLAHESFSIGLDTHATAGLGKPFLLARQRMLQGVRSTWYEGEIAALPDHALVIQGIDRAADRYARAVLLSIEDNRPLIAQAGPHTLCFVPLQGPKVGGWVYQRAERVGPAGMAAQ